MTGQTARGVRDEPALADVIPRLLDEANSIAQSCSPEVERVTRTGPAPAHKPSIFQDYELGRAMEIDVLVRAPAAFARAAGLATPMLDLLAALAIRRRATRGCIGLAPSHACAPPRAKKLFAAEESGTSTMLIGCLARLDR